MEWEWHIHRGVKFLILFSTFMMFSADCFAVNGKVSKADTTVYGTQRVTDYNGVGKAPCKLESITDTKGNVLAKVCPRDAFQCSQQGSCLAKSEKGNILLNVSKKGRDGKWRFSVIDQKKCKYGTGAIINNSRACLIPYKTLACGPANPPGTIIHMKEAVGKSYQVDGGPVQVHDGNFICGDKNMSFGPNRFDVFKGYRDEPTNEFLNVGFADHKTGPSFAAIQGGKLRDDDVLIKSLQDLVLTSGADPTPGSVANRSPASGAAGAR